MALHDCTATLASAAPGGHHEGLTAQYHVDLGQRGCGLVEKCCGESRSSSTAGGWRRGEADAGGQGGDTEADEETAHQKNATLIIFRHHQTPYPKNPIEGHHGGRGNPRLPVLDHSMSFRSVSTIFAASANFAANIARTF
jgi:hypothetical protein